MAAPPPPPPPPPAPAPIAKPNNNKLLESIRQGTGLKKVPDSAKNDRSAVTVPTAKSGGNVAAMPLPSGLKGSGAAPLSIADALKLRNAKGASGSPNIAPPKRCDVPAPNQNVGQAPNVPKPPDQTSKPSLNSADKIFPPPPPPMPSGAASKPFAPPPVPPGIQNKPFAPPPMASIPPPPPMSMDSTDRPFAPPPMNFIRPLAPPMPHQNIGNSISTPPPPPPPSDLKPPSRPPVYHSMKPSTQDAFLPPPMRIPNISNGSIRNTPPTFAPPPPPPPTSTMPTKQMPSISIGKPAPNRPPQINSDVTVSKPSLPPRTEIQGTFDSRFTFIDESFFPPPQTVMKRPKAVA